MTEGFCRRAQSRSVSFPSPASLYELDLLRLNGAGSGHGQ